MSSRRADISQHRQRRILCVNVTARVVCVRNGFGKQAA